MGPHYSSSSQSTQSVTPAEHSQDNRPVVECLLPGSASQPRAITSNCLLLIDTVLSFINSYRIRGDTAIKFAL